VLAVSSKLLELIQERKLDVVVIGSLHFDPERRARLESVCGEHQIRLLKFTFRLDNLNTAS
jgi:diphthamide synthase (EF-2-diphthine--ammonia ligase)